MVRSKNGSIATQLRLTKYLKTQKSNLVLRQKATLFLDSKSKMMLK